MGQTQWLHYLPNAGVEWKILLSCILTMILLAPLLVADVEQLWICAIISS